MTHQGSGMSRKRFIDRMLGLGAAGLAAAVGFPVIRYLIPPRVAEAVVNRVVAPFKPGDLPPNSGKVFKFGDQPALLIRTPSGELRAFTARCTHLDCTVQYRDDLSHIWCACHDGHYDLSGRNIAGPPPAPLTAYTVNQRGDDIVVSKET